MAEAVRRPTGLQVLVASPIHPGQGASARIGTGRSLSVATGAEEGRLTPRAEAGLDGAVEAGGSVAAAMRAGEVPTADPLPSILWSCRPKQRRWHRRHHGDPMALLYIVDILPLP